MTSGSSHKVSSRRAIFINPRFQGGVVLRFAVVILAGAVLFAGFFHYSAKRSLLAASFRGHYDFPAPYTIVGEDMVRGLAVLCAGVMTACILLFLHLVRGIRNGVARLLETLRASMEGDLSSPTEARGPSDIAALAGRIDAFRSRTLGQIVAIRAEAGLLRTETLAAEEFARRWDALKRAVRMVAP
jgi:hypothetical protein